MIVGKPSGKNIFVFIIVVNDSFPRSKYEDLSLEKLNDCIYELEMDEVRKFFPTSGNILICLQTSQI